MALGRVVPARRAIPIAASSAREGEKARNGCLWIVVSVKSLEKLDLDVFLVVDHDSVLKNRCSTLRKTHGVPNLIRPEVCVRAARP